MGILSALLGAGRKNDIIDQAIEHLGRQGSVMGTAFREISYSDVVNYIKAKSCKVTAVRQKPGGDWVEFIATVRGTQYAVWLDKTFEGDGSVLTARESSKSA